MSGCCVAVVASLLSNPLPQAPTLLRSGSQVGLK
jgi:hypothetical protein